MEMDHQSELAVAAKKLEDEKARLDEELQNQRIVIEREMEQQVIELRVENNKLLDDIETIKNDHTEELKRLELEHAENIIQAEEEAAKAAEAEAPVQVVVQEEDSSEDEDALLEEFPVLLPEQGNWLQTENVRLRAELKNARKLAKRRAKQLRAAKRDLDEMEAERDVTLGRALAIRSSYYSVSPRVLSTHVLLFVA